MNAMCPKREKQPRQRCWSSQWPRQPREAVLVTKHDFRHFTTKAMGDHQTYMNQDEPNKNDQPEKMKTTRRLSSAKDFGKPRKARGQCRRHDDAGEDLQGREDKDYAEIT